MNELFTADQLQIMFWLSYAMLFGAGVLGAAFLAKRLPAFLERHHFFDHKSLPQRRLTAGGIAIIIPFLTVLGAAVIFNPLAFNADRRQLVFLFAALAIIAALGLYDDRKGASPALKITVQTVAALVFMAGGQSLGFITSPFHNTIAIGAWGAVPLILWILAITNAMNLIDGIDGLAAGIALISAITLFTISHIFGENTLASFAALLAGCLFGFIRMNLPPAKLFLGDTGSLFLGFALATVSVMERRKGSVTLTLLVPMVILTIPLLDAVLAFFRRTLRGQNPMKGDSGHLHHRLRRLGLSDTQINMMLYLFSVYLAITAGVLAFFPKETAMVVLILLAIGIFMALQMLRSIERGIK